MSNKRSWTIEHNCDYDYCVRGPTLKRDELVRVIEYSAYEALKAQLAEVTRERDKLKKALVGWGQDAQEVRTILAAEQIKAERYRDALEVIVNKWDDLGINQEPYTTNVARKALTEAEGE